MTNEEVRALAVGGPNLFAGTYRGGIFRSEDVERQNRTEDRAMSIVGRHVKEYQSCVFVDYYQSVSPSWS